MKIIITAGLLIAMSSAAFADHDNGKGKSQDHKPVNTAGADGVDGINGTDGKDGTDGAKGRDGAAGAQGGAGADGIRGSDGSDGADGTDGRNGTAGAAGVRGAAGDAGVTPLGSLSFAAATSAFTGDGIGFGLSDSTYGGLEGSAAAGFDLGNGWTAVVGVTTDFNTKSAVSAGVGYNF